jgi:peptidylprolyl isomerase/peptidyl-prolyl cis-trans isomerase D
MYLILIVGMALFAFVFDPSTLMNSKGNPDVIGEINGEEINRQEFALQVENYKSQGGPSMSQMRAVNDVWNAMVSEKIFNDQLEKAGIVIGEKDIWDAMIQLPEIQNSPLFQNEAKLFDEERLKEYIANIRDEADAGNDQAWSNWLLSEENIKVNLERQAYLSLVSAGLGASLKEGERDYLFANTKMDAKFVYVPYETIPDSLGYVSREEIQEYLENNSKRFKQESARSLQYVKFDIEPSDSDNEMVKAEVAKHIDDRLEYNKVAKNEVTIIGLQNTNDYPAFFDENGSDLNLDESYKFENEVSVTLKDSLFNGEEGTIFGPYLENGFYKLSKIVEVVEIPDSVKSSHILVPYAGSQRSASTKTKEAAKKTIDSIFKLVRNNKAKFTLIANEINTDGSKGKGGDIGWTRKNQGFSSGFDRKFADFIYHNKTGSIDVVETAFGYHIIRIDEQTDRQRALKIATFARLVDASEETENDIFEQAETLAAALNEGGLLQDLAKEEGFEVQSALNLKVLEEMVPGLGSQRQIVTWAFNEDTGLNDFRRFEIDNFGKRSHVVAVVSNKTDGDGVVLSSEVLTKIRPELINKKKAGLIMDKMSGATLEEIAKSVNVSVRNASSVNLSSPLLSGVGNEPAVVGAMSTLKVDEVSEIMEGEKGVFVLQVTKREDPAALDNYDVFRKKIVTELKGRTYLMYQVLEQTADVKDNRGLFY